MPIYVCKNMKCSIYNIEEIRNTTLRVFKGEIIDTGKICPECNKDCEVLHTPGMPIAFGRNIYNGLKTRIDEGY